MVDGKCSKYFPKKFLTSSSFDEDRYPLYRRRDNSCIINRNGIDLDNRYVVPHNCHLLLKYKAHINVEWCNQSRSIKYLFKYVNKGKDRVTAEFYKSSVDEETGTVIDEINMYYDCRYVSPCEASWRLFGYEIQYKNPTVERLSFHLPNQQAVVFEDDEPIDDILNRPTVSHSMFVEWFEANKKFPEARLLTYAEMPTKFGCMLQKGLLDDNKEYVDAVNQSSHWASATALRKLFVTLLTSNSIAKSELVWQAVWHHLSEDAQEIQKLLSIWGKSLQDYPDMPLPDNEVTMLTSNRLIHEERCTIALNSYWRTKAPMMHKHCFEALDKTMRDLLRFKNSCSLDMTFGGKTVVFGGDFRQILPVIPKGARQDIVGASTNSSYLWKNCKIFRLTKNLRLQHSQDATRYRELEDFATWIAAVGDGDIGKATDVDFEISIPQKHLLDSGDDPIATIVENTFPMFRTTANEENFLENRAILAPTLDVVDSIN
ncbi:uncharacterized protein LOC116033051 [Ipomoea triloba]|uniref:uncharacterized protein LOC116033051 n=1 Tax=Ipomoea triloba TaxID=35885 RepID=UPI00125DE654|nr:uncharacterized protein LOC116033051 [Ipomoea triloba]